MTTKLYWNDSHLARFAARVEESWPRDGNRAVVLNQTAFYPTGGGQPGDTGLINSARVIEVEMADDGRILHLLAGDAPVAVGEEVSGEIDWDRRLEMIQQHTGQHILSQAFFRLFGAETRGFRITEHAAEIDLTLEAHPDEIEQAVARAEELANRVVFDNREIRVHHLAPEEAAKLPLRKESFIADGIRVVEIADYDWSPCGGTHAARTGEVGLIAARSWERAKQMTRVQFVCGGRALRDYRIANRAAEAVARRFSVGREETEAALARLFDENKNLLRRARELAGIAATVEARELIEATAASDGLKIVSRVFEDRDVEELKLLAHRLVETDGVIALLATNAGATARLVFARSANLPDGVSADMNASMRAACERLGGRGGGKPDFAQGGGSKTGDLIPALDAAAARVKRS